MPTEQQAREFGSNQVEPPKMREVTHPMMDSFTKDNLVVYAGEPGAGGAAHVYRIYDRAEMAEGNGKIIAEIQLQHGPRKEVGVNGIGNGTLLLIVLDFLKSLQNGDYSTRENSLAITDLERVMGWQKQRELDRAGRGVLGTWQK
jgi:hypothetical protein